MGVRRCVFFLKIDHGALTYGLNNIYKNKSTNLKYDICLLFWGDGLGPYVRSTGAKQPKCVAD